ncbi:MAG: SIMPL domain-containing protein [Oscillospiraceae bacterium]
MEHTITVRGEGRVKKSPDLAVLEIVAVAESESYKEAAALAAKQKDALCEAFLALDFKRTDIKTTSYSSNVRYEYETDEKGLQKRVFAGYVCTHSASLSFETSPNMIASVLSAAGKSDVNVQLNLRFTVRDKTALDRELIAHACKNAREKAEIIAASMGVKLGKPAKVCYNFADERPYSRTAFAKDNSVRSARAQSEAMNITPDDIEIIDEVLCVFLIAD